MRDTQDVHSGIRINVAMAAIILLAGCGGTTVHGAVPAPPSVTAMPHKPARTATPSPTPTQERVFVPGPPAIAYRTQEGAATLQVRRYSWQRTANGQQSVSPQHHYLVLDVRITATEGKVPVNPLYFVARTSDQTFAPTLGADGNEPVLASADLNTNEYFDGIITFDAPPSRMIVQVNDELGRNVGEVVIPAPALPAEGDPDAPAEGDPDAPAESDPDVPVGSDQEAPTPSAESDPDAPTEGDQDPATEGG
jgi:hypothetical protein